MAVRTVRNANVDTDLTTIALSGLDSTAGMVVQTATDTFTKRTLTAANGIGITDPTGAGGDPTFAINPAKVQQFVATYAALTALVTATGLIDNGIYCTYGRTAEEDGGFGFWRYDSGSSATANSGTILAIDGGGAGRFFRLFDPAEPVNAQWFGFKVGGGNSDATANTTALQAALNAYYWVQLPDGTAYLNIITHTRANRLSGYGKTRTLLYRGNSSLNFGFSATSFTNPIYEDFTFDGNAAGNASSGGHTGIRLVSCTNPELRRVKLDNWVGTFLGADVGAGASISGGSGGYTEECEGSGCYDGYLIVTQPDFTHKRLRIGAHVRFGSLADNGSHRYSDIDCEAIGSGTDVDLDAGCGNIVVQNCDDIVSDNPYCADSTYGYGYQIQIGCDRFALNNPRVVGNRWDGVGLTGGGVTPNVRGRVNGGSGYNNDLSNLAVNDESQGITVDGFVDQGGSYQGINVFRSSPKLSGCSGDVTVWDAATVTGISVGAAGSGYTNGTHTNLAVVGPTYFIQMTANVTVSGGAVTAVSINTLGYFGLPPTSLTGLTIPTIPGGGSGALFTITLSGASSGTCADTTIRDHVAGGTLRIQAGCASKRIISSGNRFTTTTDTGGEILPDFLPQGTRVLFKLISANMNSTSDQQFTKVGEFTSWTASGGGAYKLVNPSINLTTAAGGVYSAASKGGDQLVASSQTYATASTVGTSSQQLTGSALGNGVRTETPYLSLTTGQGVAATADLYIFGVPLS